MTVHYDAVCFSRRRFWNPESSELPSGIQTHPPREGRYRAILGEWRKSPLRSAAGCQPLNSRRADNCSILGIPFCAKIVLHPVDVPGTNCNVPQGLSHCSGRHWCIQRHQKQCRSHLVGNIVFRHTTAFFLLPSSGRSLDILHLFSLAVRSVYKELHADHETGAADNK